MRGVPDDILTDFCEDFQQGKVFKPIKIFCPPESAKLLRDLIPGGATIISCERLDDAVFATWPELGPKTLADEKKTATGEKTK